ncbi:MAG: transposase [Candidatus Eisenbacteria bacterium]|uniref:Transposase n=1 Tax=Eiseniibacteriota bacterium TaxID=2212470 RepID=A0A956N9K0_UNCEI|nr:transposase [Candidatus Eisenbacteria bacterium]
MPWALRARLSVDRRLLSDVLSSFLRPIFAWERRRGRSLGIWDGETGAVTFLQRFGGALNLHPHFHSLIPDGLFVPVPGREELEFVPLPPPSAEEVRTLTERIAALGPSVGITEPPSP